MTWLTRFWTFLRGRDVNPDIDEELQFHLDARIADNLRAGMPTAEARRDALARFGSRAGIRERTRDANILVTLESLWQDMRHGARLFARNPGMTTIAIISIAFGTGANVAALSLANVLLFRPLPIPARDRVMAIGVRPSQVRSDQMLMSYPDYEDLRNRVQTFEGLLAYRYEIVGLDTGATGSARVRFASFVTDDYFQTLAIQTVVGRGFLPGEASRTNPQPVVVLSDGLWRELYGGDPQAVGRTMHVGGLEFRIVGVAPAEFTGLHPIVREALYLPLGMLPRIVDVGRHDMLEQRGLHTLAMKGRLKPGVSLHTAQVELRSIAADLERVYPETNSNQTIVAETELQNDIHTRPLFAPLVTVVTILSIAVLCVACANVAGLLLSRAPLRAREMSLRLAVGAARTRLIRQLITESLGLALAGGAAGLLVAQAGMVLLRQIQFPSSVLAPPRIELDERTLTATLVIAMAVAFVVGLGPALTATRVDLVGSLKNGDRAGSSRRGLSGRSTLVAVQIALSLVLLTVAASSIQLFQRQLATGPGFRTTQMAKITIDAGQASYTNADARTFFTQVLRDARALPGARLASVTSAMPLYSWQLVALAGPGASSTTLQDQVSVRSNSVDDEYFSTMGMEVLQGRAFTTADDATSTSVAIVNDTLAARYWPDGNAIGQRLHVMDDWSTVVEVVGVVPTTTFHYPGELPQAGIFFPYLQRPRGQMTLLVQTVADSASVLQPMGQLVERLDPRVPTFDLQTVEQFYDISATGALKVVMRLMTALGVMGMALTAIGLYSLVAYSVSRRTREIGIRIAVGATTARIVGMVLRQGMTPAWIGLPVGLALSAGTAVLLPAIVPVTVNVDAETFYLAVPFIVISIAISAFVPARRAAKVNPVVALRCD